MVIALPSCEYLSQFNAFINNIFLITDDFLILEDYIFFPFNSSVNDTRCFTFEPIDDEFVEENEEVIIYPISTRNLDNFPMGQDEFIMTIYDDDGEIIEH